MEKLTASLGYRFKDEALLKRALTHPSASGQDNQRLEFLGDAVLQYCMSRVLYEKHESLHEGGLTHLRAAMVREAALAGVARSVSLQQHILMSKSQELDGGRENPSILADAMEAVLAAVCLDGGVDEALALVRRIWLPEAELIELAKDSKSRLQELVQASGHPVPEYETIGEEGPPHDRRFTVRVSLLGKPPATGTGKTKRSAEQAAAEQALLMLKK